MQKRILITGGAGFIGYHTAQRLSEAGHSVVIIDNLNAYYTPRLKWYRMNALTEAYQMPFKIVDLVDSEILDGIFHRYKPQIVINLAAQAGVRYSEINPQAYTQSNIVGFTNVLTSCKKHQVEHLLYASSSSVYGDATIPFSEDNPLGKPLSYYALTKQINETMADYFVADTGIPATGLRFFTVYGPAGRPDMAYWTFSEKILAGTPITLYGEGKVARDFTYCDDVTNALERLLVTPNAHQVINIGNNNPIPVIDLVTKLEQAYGKKAIIHYADLPTTDPMVTWCDQRNLQKVTGFTPETTFDQGILNFARWFVDTKCKWQ